ncbi:hypothetical protein [Thiohalorhabdus methylotrophus]|uniref:Uncharacterized protein n=1 Tax=Thiohalorhabdus methylotrophus TaxID=3242694 RepID=A0ABV4TYN4_9GAMM
MKDFAYLLIERRSGYKQLVVFLSDQGRYRHRFLADAYRHEMGIATRKPGALRTASGRGYAPPSPQSPPEIMLKNDGLLYLMFESSASVFVWDARVRRFKRYWLSD